MVNVITIKVSKIHSHALHGYCTNERRVRKRDKIVRCDLRPQQKMERERGRGIWQRGN